MASYWERYNRNAQPSDKAAVSEHTFGWTQHPLHGPGMELFGDAKSALDLGCGVGYEVALLAKEGIVATGVDCSAAAIDRAYEKFEELTAPAEFVHADVEQFLRATDRTWDVIYSVFGAAWFTDPGTLTRLVFSRLNPGGRYIVAHAPAVEGCFGPQGMYGFGLRRKADYVIRYSYPPSTWRMLALQAGFSSASARVLEGPDRDALGTLLVEAHKAPA